ncbi:MAG: UDP-3-O-(3-hydroxymyristoyl)glucosamine N-acyltransferase [Chthoniobacterales bacterium]
MMTLQEIALLVNGEIFSSSPDAAKSSILGLASLRDAVAGDVTFYGSPRYLSDLRQTKATAVLVPKNFDEQLSSALIKVENPSVAFDLVIAAMAPEKAESSPVIHAKAIISPKATIGTNVSIAPFAVIEEGAIIGNNTIISAHCYIGPQTCIGEDCLLHPHVTIRERCLIGNRVTLHPGVVIGSCGFGYLFQEGIHKKIPQHGIVQIDDDVEIGSNTTIDRARFGRTHIGIGTKIDNLVQIAHNVIIGPHNIICSQAGISGSTRTGSHVTLAGQVGLSGHIEIGDRAIIGAQAGVSKNVKPDAILIGSPARPMQGWKQNNFYISNLDKLFDRVKALEKSLEHQ